MRPSTDTHGDPRISRHPAPVARVQRLAAMTLERPDLERARAFFADFGLVPTDGERGEVVHLRGAGPDPVLVSLVHGPRVRLRGVTFVADDEALAALSAAERTPIEPMPAPGGGRRVRLSDPTGLAVDIVAGWPAATPSGTPHETARETRPETSLETSTARPAPPLGGPRDATEPIRLEVLPPAIDHLGHVALEVVDFERAVEWYTRQLGLLPSDVQVLDDGTPSLVFLRCDRGSTPTEHHTVVLARSVEDRLSHAAFHVADLDALAMGQRVLRERGWSHGWGIGRHLMGSQLFDYWRDPWRVLMEHYTDSDRFDAERRPGVLPMSRAAMAQWGPPMPDDFVDTRLTPRRLVTIARGLRSEPALTLNRLLQLKRAMTP